MVKYFKTKKGYLYKLLKNGKKKRISQKEYKKKNKSRKNINMIGGGEYEEDIYNQFVRSSINFDGKRCLDIGTRNGLNCITLVKLGAKEVIGIDIDDTRFDEMPPNDKIKLIKQNLFEFDDSEKFDVITCFLWNMNLPQYDKVMEKIKSLLKPNGTVYIGIHDELYKYDEYGGSVPDLLRKNFQSVRILFETNPYQWIIQARNPIEI